MGFAIRIQATVHLLKVLHVSLTNLPTKNVTRSTCLPNKSPYKKRDVTFLSRLPYKLQTPPPKSSLTAAAYVGSILRRRLMTTAASYYDDGSVLGTGGVFAGGGGTRELIVK